MPLSRRQLLRGGLASGTLLMSNPLGVLAEVLGTPSVEFAADRGSLLHPGLRVAHGDMHNHSHLSDGNGDPLRFFDSIRAGGMDFAALTDHSTLSWGAAGAGTDAACGPVDGDVQHGSSGPCRSVAGLDEEGWALTRALADGADDPESFAAIAGFEWSSPFLGHMNVWFSQRWIDPLHTAGGGPEGFHEWLEEVPGVGPAAHGHLGPVLHEALRAAPSTGVGMRAFYEWLKAAPDTPGFGGGLDGIAGFNHPGREPGRFGYFYYDAALRDRIVSMEILNRGDDYLFEGYVARSGAPSPLVECLNAGWRVGLIGVTDEHSPDWGDVRHINKPRAGLWLDPGLGLSRAGVREALEDRRVYATFHYGLRLDATLNDVQMGRGVDHGAGVATFAVDLDRGTEWVGKALEIQVLRPGAKFPEVPHVEPIVVPGEGVITFDVPLDRGQGDWVVLRVADPSRANNQLGPAGHPCNNRAVAYTSPWWLEG